VPTRTAPRLAAKTLQRLSYEILRSRPGQSASAALVRMARRSDSVRAHRCSCCHRSRPPNGTQAGHRSRPNDRRASAEIDALAREDGVDCHWHAQAPSAAASPASIRGISILQFGTLRVFRTSPTCFFSAFGAAGGERDGQLGATINPHAGSADAIDLDVLWQRCSGQRSRIGVTDKGTTHLLRRVARLGLIAVRIEYPGTAPAKYASR
jgi:hypothetical protein